LTADDRAAAEQQIALLSAAVTAGIGREARQGHFGVIANFLLAYPVANASAESGKARGQAYQQALDDIPAWAIAEAARRWNRGEAGEGHDYKWAPAPAVLRDVCKASLKPLNDAIDDLRALLDAMTIDQAMDPAPLPKTAVTALRSVA